MNRSPFLMQRNDSRMQILERLKWNDGVKIISQI